MNEKDFCVEVCRGQSCRFFGKTLDKQVRDGLSGVENVSVEEGGCRGVCETAPNVYLKDKDSDDGDPKKHFKNVGRISYKNRPSISVENVILEIKKEIKPDSV
jgi:NADH:ubiquinone oxidoreductase subunit E